MKYYKEKSKTKHGASTSEVGLTMQGEIIVGKFVDRDRPDYASLLKAQMHESLGDRYVDYDDEQGYTCEDGGCAEDSCH
jgi:2-oxoglutarate ferredoxin oxidoreductase subunit beta